MRSCQRAETPRKSLLPLNKIDGCSYTSLIQKIVKRIKEPTNMTSGGEGLVKDSCKKWMFQFPILPSLGFSEKNLHANRAASTGHGVQRQGATNGHGTLCQGAVYMTYRGSDVPGAAGEEVRTGRFFSNGTGWAGVGAIIAIGVLFPKNIVVGNVCPQKGLSTNQFSKGLFHQQFHGTILWNFFDFLRHGFDFCVAGISYEQYHIILVLIGLLMRSCQRAETPGKSLLPLKKIDGSFWMMIKLW